MSLVSIGNAQVHVETHGHGEDLLLVAGLGGSGTFWRGQVGPLSSRYRVTVFDHRGVGRSSPAPLISSVDELANDAVRVMDALGIERAHLVGHSTGGAIGQHVALAAPGRLRSLVLSGTWAGPSPLFIELFRLRRDVLINCGLKQYLLLGAMLANPAWHLQEHFTNAEEYLVDRTRAAPRLDVELGRLNAVMTHDLRHRLAGIRVPTAVICARDDQIVPEPLASEPARLIPGALLEVLPEGGHFCPLTVTERYNEVLLRSLERVGSGEGGQAGVAAAK